MSSELERLKAENALKKAERIDSFGLTIQLLNSDQDISQVTPYDSFTFEDSIRLFVNIKTLNEIRESMKPRLDEDSGLHVVTK